MANVDLNAAKRGVKAKKPADTATSRAALRDIPNSRLYVELRELDLRIEQYSNRRKAEICDMSQAMDLPLRILRLQFYTTHHNQERLLPSSATLTPPQWRWRDDPACPPSWSFHIYGTFVDQGATNTPMPAATAGAAPLPGHATPATVQTPPAPKATADRNWTAAMSSVQIRIEDPGKPGAAPEVVRWERNRHVGQHKESIEFHRQGSTPARVFVTMVRDFAPEYFRVTGALAAALKRTGGTRGQVQRALRAFVAAHSAPDAANPAFVTPDAALKALLRTDRFEVSQISDHVDACLEPLPPVSLDYTIALDGPSPSAPVCHDVEVAWALKPAMLKMPPFLDRLDARAALEARDVKVAEALAAFKLAQRRRRFLMGFATAPAEFIRKFVAASAREVREQGGQPVEMAAAANFKLPWAQESAVHYLESLDQQLQAQARAGAR